MGNNTVKSRCLRIGHRGACGYEPENTLRSFRKAIDLGVDMIELDVYCCASGELAVIHDDTVERTTDGSGPTESLTAQQLAQLNVHGGEKIPLLAQVLDATNRAVAINIELKGSGTALPVAALIEDYVACKQWSYDDFYVSSFSSEKLATFHSTLPAVKTGLLCMPRAISRSRISLYAARYYALGVHKVDANASLVEELHENGLKVYVYTVNDPGQIASMKRFGVDGIFSDFPDRV